ncbi:MAG: hemerythrin domain-containing protein [Thermoplasmata archaeon]
MVSLSSVLKFEGSIVTKPLREQHKVTVKIVEDYLDENKFDGFVSHFAFLLDTHFRIEEEILFPTFIPILKQYLPNTEPIRLLLGDHRAIKHMIAYISEKQNVEANSKELSMLLLNHIFREENGIFNLIDTYMPEDIKKQTHEKIYAFMTKN